jgi:hypothetical protein
LSPQWFLSFRFAHQNTIHSFPLPHTRYMPHLSYSSRCYHRHSTGWAVQIMELLIMNFSPFPCHFVPLRPKYSPQHPILKHPQPTFLPQCQRPSFPPTWGWNTGANLCSRRITKQPIFTGLHLVTFYALITQRLWNERTMEMYVHHPLVSTFRSQNCLSDFNKLLISMPRWICPNISLLVRTGTKDSRLTQSVIIHSAVCLTTDP